MASFGASSGIRRRSGSSSRQTTATSTAVLTVVGTGIAIGLHLTPEARAAWESAEEALFLVGDPVAAALLAGLNPRARSLQEHYRAGRPRLDAYEAMVEEILSPVRAGRDVCTAFYGHPGIFVYPGHEAVRRARREGFEARLLPGISALARSASGRGPRTQTTSVGGSETCPASGGCRSPRSARCSRSASTCRRHGSSCRVTQRSATSTHRRPSSAFRRQCARTRRRCERPALVDCDAPDALGSRCHLEGSESEPTVEAPRRKKIIEFLIRVHKEPFLQSAYSDNPTTAMLGAGLKQDEIDLIRSGDLAAIQDALTPDQERRIVWHPPTVWQQPKAASRYADGFADRRRHGDRDRRAPDAGSARGLGVGRRGPLPRGGPRLGHVAGGAQPTCTFHPRPLPRRATPTRSVRGHGRGDLVPAPRRADGLRRVLRPPGHLRLPGPRSGRRARREGFEARLLPGISALDCLWCDLGVDPALAGCQIYHATDFLEDERTPDIKATLILLQISVIGQSDHLEEPDWSGLPLLVDYLRRFYPDGSRGHRLRGVAVLCSAGPSSSAFRWPSSPLLRLTPAMTLVVPPVP